MMLLEPASVSSAGWKMILSRPQGDPRSASILVAVMTMALWESWPQVCLATFSPIDHVGQGVHVCPGATVFSRPSAVQNP